MYEPIEKGLKITSSELSYISISTTTVHALTLFSKKTRVFILFLREKIICSL